MKDEKDKVLSQIRLSLETAHLPAARATIPPHNVAEAGDRAEMIASFRRELERIGGLSYLARNDEEAIEIVLNLLGEAGGKDLMMWDEFEIPVLGLGDALRVKGYARLEVDVPRDAEGRRTKLAELGRAAAGITAALAGLADTGTLALVTSAKRSRLASLLPPMHIAILPTLRLFDSMAAFFAAYPEVTKDASNLVFVTGPSRTADIELTLQRGVHGPKFLQVVLLDY